MLQKMANNNYKYTLLRENAKTDVKNSQISVCKIFGLFAMSVLIILYYTTKVTIDIDSKRFAVENSTEVVVNATEVVTEKSLNSTVEFEKLLNSTIEFETTTSIATLVPALHVSKKVLILNITTPKAFTSSVTQKFLNVSETFLKNQKITPTPKIKLKKSLNSGKFFVNTEQCQMPYVDPFSAEAKKMFKPDKYEACSNDRALISSSFNETQQRYILHINYTNMEDINCCYQQIVRSGSGNSADRKFDLLPCTNFNQNFAVPQHIDGMIVICKSRSKNQTIQKDAFSFIQERNYTSEFKSSNVRFGKPNVLLIGIDSLSRFNFRRNMPKTAKFLMENNFIEMEGYNKVGDNTFPNLMPLLTGLNESTSFSKCNPKKVGGLDNCSFIWKNFKAHNYTTAYAEDTTGISTFNYIKKGFKNAPTDYYLRPFMMAVEKKFTNKRKAGLIYCAGRRHTANYVYDFALEFAKRHQNKPAFGLIWTNSFSHNWYSTSSSMDVEIHEYFEKMKSTGILETSIVLFFSDHGCRWGPLLNLPEGFLEERLPMFFMSLPKWFHETYPEHIKALKINANRLTTPFDVHKTLLHMLDLNQTIQNEQKSNFSCQKSQSLFVEVPKNRTCKDACIPNHWCTCDPFEIYSTYSPDVRKVTDSIIDEINKYLKGNFSTLCQTLKRKSISSAEVKVDSKEKYSHKETLRIKFKVSPKDAKFQATAVVNLLTHHVQVEIEDISRINSYENDSKCINDKLAKKFCICKK